MIAFRVELVPNLWTIGPETSATGFGKFGDFLEVAHNGGTSSRAKIRKLRTTWWMLIQIRHLCADRPNSFGDQQESPGRTAWGKMTIS